MARTSDGILEGKWTFYYVRFDCDGSDKWKFSTENRNIRRRSRADPTKFQTAEETDKIVDEILADIKSSEPVTEGGEVFYPGELELNSIRDNKEHGIPVIEEVWESVLKM